MQFLKVGDNMSDKKAASSWEDTIQDEDTSWESTIQELEEEEKTPEEMSYAETLGLKIGEGASLGLTDQLSGAVGAVVDKLTPESDVDKKLREEGFKLPEESLLDSYRSARDYSKRLQEKSSEDNPKLSMAADIAGGIASGSMIGKVAQGTGRLAKAAKFLPGGTELKSGQGILRSAKDLAIEGAKAGALTGFAKGEGDLTKGELTDVGMDAIKGAGIGSVAAPVLTGSAKTALGAAKLLGRGTKAIGRAILGGDKFDAGKLAGKKGIDLFNEEQVTKELSKTASSIRKEIGKIFKDNDKFEMIKILDEAGVKIQAGQPIKEALDEMIEKGVMDTSDRKAIDQFSNYLNELITKKSTKLQKIEQSIEKSAAQKANKAVRAGGQVETRTEFDTPIEDIVPLPEFKGSVKGVQDKISYNTPEGKVFENVLSQKAELDSLIPDVLPDIDSLDAKTLDRVIKSVEKYTTPEANPSVSETARGLLKSLKDLRKEAGEGLADINVAERYRNLSKGMSVKERLGKNLFKKSEASVDALESEIKSLSLAKPDSKQADKLEFLKKQLGEVNPDALRRVESELELPSALSKIAKRDTDGTIQSLTPTTGFGLIGPAQVKLGQTVGRVSKRISDEIIDGKKVLKKLADDTYLTKLYEKIGKLTGPARDNYSEVLEKLTMPDMPDRKKNALLMGLMQDPAFRKMINKADAEEEVEE